MLLDNKTQFDPTEPFKVYDYLKRNTEKGQMDIVTGYFSVAALHKLYTEINEPDKFQLILGDLLQDYEEKDKIIDLLTGSLNIDKVLRLTPQAQNAIHFLEQNKVLIKTVERSFCHAKSYIFSHSHDSRHHYHIVGSSNLTEAGLGIRDTSNIELNQAFSGNDYGFKDVKNWFDQLWQQANENTEILDDQGNKKKIPVKDYIIQVIKDLSKGYTPLELYYKILFELFKEDILSLELDPNFKNEIGHLEETEIWRALFSFQRKGVLSLIKMLQRHNGAILADAVGLGKTWQALAVIKFFELKGYKIVLLCPKKLSQNWKQYLYGNKSRFEKDRMQYWVRYHTDLQEGRLDKYEDPPLYGLQNNPKLLLVMDESHNLRNDKSGRYQFLVDHILKKNRDVKVLLLSATPINNHLTDIRNQFKLMTKGTDDGFKENETLELKSLESIFRQAQADFKIWSEQPERNISEFIHNLPKKFFDLTDSLIVARTRDLITKEFGELSFPKKDKPENHFIQLDEIGKYKSFNDLLNALEVNLTAYQPSKYSLHTKPKSVLEDPEQRERFLVRMMYILLVKRLESSWKSFQGTVNNILAHHERALKKVNHYIMHGGADLLEGIEEDESFVEDLEEEVLEEKAFVDEKGNEIPVTDITLGKKNPIPLSSIKNIKLFRDHIAEDVQMLTELKNCLLEFEENIAQGSQKDLKLEKLIDVIEQKRTARSNQKVIIFTAFKDTANYLFQSLKDRGYKNIAKVTGQGSKIDEEPELNSFEEVLYRFAPYSKLFKERDWTEDFNYKGQKVPETYTEWVDKIKTIRPEVYKDYIEKPVDILIATDCLSEGQNLQDSDCVINYDIHWNPVRLIQRFGRIDRLGSPNKSVVGINFWPGADYDDFLNLKDRVEKRMALMTIVGSEVQQTSPEFEMMVANNPLLTSHEDKMFRQLQITWEDIDDAEVLGLDDLSLERYRQELLEFFQKERKKLEAIPNGVFSGFRLKKNDVFDEKLPTGIIALLGYPKAPEKARKLHKYKEYHLLYTTPDGPSQFINHKDVLDILSSHKNYDRFVKSSVERGEEEAVESLKLMLKKWMDAQVPKQAEAAINDMFKGHVKPKISPEAERLEKYYQPENFDLITWMAISK